MSNFPDIIKLLETLKNEKQLVLFVPKDKKVISSTTDYSTNIVGSVEKDNIFGTQFHPEKSDKLGLKLIENFISI